MYVKSLALKGFKSFADPVTLDLQPGVNVVVGPNGSGKSNVIDAVAWVLGAQGAKSLRGGKMDDVIFAGTGKRSALGRAEVSLTIDNSDGRIPVEFTEVTITRTLFRTGESEYAINGVSCRLLDIQDLLSDSGVGRRQHVIVSQGNLGAILNARAEDRRMVIEEAAGVLKYRKRRERSQRRLEATEQNLDRLQDLVREVRQQLRPLQKQAEAARRHEEASTELRAIRVYVAGRDIAQLRHRQETSASEFSELNERNESLRVALVEADAAVTEAEAATAGFNTDELGDQIERLERVLQKAKGLSAVMSERTRSLEKELLAQVSQDVVSSLENDANNVRTELSTVESEQQSIEEPFEELTRVEAELASEWLVFEEKWGEGLPVVNTEAASIRGELASLYKTIETLQRDIERAENRKQQLIADLSKTDSEIESTITSKSALEEAQVEFQQQLEAGEAGRREVEARVESLASTFQDAQRVASVAQAKVEALTTALDASRAKAGVAQLAEVEGITGTLAELVDVDDGYQAAFEAAAGEAMASVVVESVDVARSALKHLREGDIDGAVLVMGQHAEPPMGAPEGENNVETLRSHVRGVTPAVEALLDRILCCCVVVDGEWQQAVDFALAYPELVTVTRRGDRFTRNSWRIGTGGQGATMTAVQAAESEVHAASAALEEARLAHDSIKAERANAQNAEREARKKVSDGERAIVNATNNLERLESRRSGLKSDLERFAQSIGGIESRLVEERERVVELEQRLPELELAQASGEERARLWREARGVLEARSGELRSQRHQLEVKSKSLGERSEFLGRRLESLEARLAQHKVEVEQAAQRRVRIQTSIEVIGRLKALVDSRISTVADELEVVREFRRAERERQREVTERLESVRRQRSSIERELLQVGEKRQQFEVRQAEIRTRLEGLLETLERELGVQPEVAMEAPEPELPEGKTAKQRATELDRELRQMGPVNPLALEEYESVKERHEFLDQQLKDIQESRRELVRVIRAVDAEIVEVFRSAFEDVSHHFDQLFAMLFPGGSGRLKLTDPENPLETGVEIEAKPSGKNVRTLTLLSGGERSLVAMAFLFAIFRSRPSPFYLLDEVEAALDDVNLSRFLKLVEEFRQEAQLVIVSHQKRTMEKADCLYGVSMQPGGSTKVVSERVEVNLTKTA